MAIDRVLATLEQYFELKNEIGTDAEPIVKAARERAGLALNEYIQSQFDHLIVEDKKRISSTSTRKIEIPPSPENIKVAWSDVVKLLDALNSVPPPPINPLQVSNKEYVKWMEIYKMWYNGKRQSSLRVITMDSLELGEEDFQK